jgi:hypothetical protein
MNITKWMVNKEILIDLPLNEVFIYEMFYDRQKKVDL